MTLYASANGARVVTASIFLPYYGACVADIQLDKPDALTSPVTLAIGNLSLVCAVIRQGSFAGLANARLVGGAGGWGQTVASQAYANSAGVPLAMVLGDLAGLVGETIKTLPTGFLGQFFIRESGPAGRVLRQIAGSEWYVDSAGITQIGARPSVAIGSHADVTSLDPGKGLAMVATEDLASWLPGNTFQNAILSSPIAIESVCYSVGNDGALRMEVIAK